MRQIVVVALVFAAGFAAAEDSAGIRVQQETAGDRVEAIVLVDSDEFINLVDLILHFDETALQPMSVSTFGSSFTFDAVEDLDYGPGMVRILRGEPHPTVPKGLNLALCSVEFEVIDPEGHHSITVVFTGAGQTNDSAVFKDDGVPTDILTTVDPVASWADLSVSIDPAEQTVGEDGYVELEIHVANMGASAVTGAGVSVALPSPLTSLPWTCQGTSGGTCSASGSGDIYENVDLPVGGSVTFILSGESSGGTGGRLTVEASVTSSAAVADPLRSNNESSAEVLIFEEIFSDGFETGQTSSWSAAVGLAAR